MDRIVRMFWDPQLQYDASSKSSMWCLGIEYKVSSTATTAGTTCSQAKKSPLEAENLGTTPTPQSLPPSTALGVPAMNPEDGGWPQPFLDDFEARLWFTYRKNFTAIPKSLDPDASSAMSMSIKLSQLVNQGGFTSDEGWGCMIRSGQCLLANSLAMLRLGRDWRRGTSSADERRLISLFADDKKAPYSIHKFVEHGAESCGRYPGQWFGPSATARCIEGLTKTNNDPDLRVYITGDGSDVYEDTFLGIAKPNGIDFKPTLILVGTRLGLDKITPVYWEALKSTLHMSQSIGIAGGRPKSSHYFIGTQGDHLFYLDPHFTRQALPYKAHVSDYQEEELNTFHTRRLRKIHVQELDPSMLIGFLIRDEMDWNEWRRGVQGVQGKAVIRVSEKDPALHGPARGRDGAIDEVETFDDEEEDEDPEAAIS